MKISEQFFREIFKKAFNTFFSNLKIWLIFLLLVLNFLDRVILLVSSWSNYILLTCTIFIIFVSILIFGRENLKCLQIKNGKKNSVFGLTNHQSILYWGSNPKISTIFFGIFLRKIFQIFAILLSTRLLLADIIFGILCNG